MDNSSNNVPDKSRWRFDPNTGQPISDDAPAPCPAASIFTGHVPVNPEGAPPQYPPQPQEPTPTPYPAAHNPRPSTATSNPSPSRPLNRCPNMPTRPRHPSRAQSTQAVAVKRRSRAPLVIGIVVVLLAALGIGGYFLYQNVFNPPAVSVERLLPPNTLGYFSFDPSPSGSQKAAMDKI